MLKQYYSAQKFNEAHSLLYSILQKNPKDKVAWLHINESDRMFRIWCVIKLEGCNDYD